MGTAFKVIGALAVLRTDRGNERYVYRGGVIESTPDTEASIKHLVSVGLVVEVKVDDEGTQAEQPELPAESWNNDRIDDWAAAQVPPIVFSNPEDTSKPPTKKHRLEQITAELAARLAQQ